ncbi:MAG: hypothetical protein WCF67_19570 [Chitinophagaceae bacterium]
MIFTLRSVFVLLVVIAFGAFRSDAQSVRGKVIYISPSQEVKFKFRSSVENYSFVNKNQSALFKIKSGSKSLQINSIAENFKAANLVITEGDNTHLFILAYKNTLDAATETFYDFSTKEKLETETQKMTAGKKSLPVTNIPVKYAASEQPSAPVIQAVNKVETKTEKVEPKAESIAEPKAELKAAPKTVVKPEEKKPEAKYADLVARADKAYLVRNLDEANDLYAAALLLKPNDSWSMSQLKTIESSKNLLKLKTATAARDQHTKKDVKLAEKSTAAKSTQEYLSEKPVAKVNNKANKTADAKEYPVIQLVIPDARHAEMKDSAAYEKFIHLADSNAWTAKNYRAALKWYDSAQRIKPQSSYPGKQIKVVKQLQSERDLITAREQRTAAFDQALKSYKKADTLRMERKYEESYKAYSAFLSQMDTSKSAGYMSRELHYINEAKDYLARLQNYLPKPKVDSVAKPIVQDEKKGKKKKKN